MRDSLAYSLFVRPGLDEVDRRCILLPIMSKMKWGKVHKENLERGHGVEWVERPPKELSPMRDPEAEEEKERERMYQEIDSEPLIRTVSDWPEWRNPLEREQEDLWLPTEEGVKVTLTDELAAAEKQMKEAEEAMKKYVASGGGNPQLQKRLSEELVLAIAKHDAIIKRMSTGK